MEAAEEEGIEAVPSGLEIRSVVCARNMLHACASHVGMPGGVAYGLEEIFDYCVSPVSKMMYNDFLRRCVDNSSALMRAVTQSMDDPAVLPCKKSQMYANSVQRICQSLQMCHLYETFSGDTHFNCPMAMKADHRPFMLHIVLNSLFCMTALVHGVHGVVHDSMRDLVSQAHKSQACVYDVQVNSAMRRACRRHWVPMLVRWKVSLRAGGRAERGPYVVKQVSADEAVSAGGGRVKYPGFGRQTIPQCVFMWMSNVLGVRMMWSETRSDHNMSALWQLRGVWQSMCSDRAVSSAVRAAAVCFGRN